MKRMQKNRINKISLMLILTILLSIFLTSFGISSLAAEKANVKIGIAWRADIESEFYTNVCRAIEAVGATPVLLGQVRSSDLAYTDEAIQPKYIDDNDILKLNYAKKIRKNSYTNSNAKEVMSGINAVIFTGGEDISPTLYKNPQNWHGIKQEQDYNATRDVSDYLLMSYCLENDIPLMGLCRGMQMLSVISGATVIQDIPTYFSLKGKQYNYEHRNEKEGNSYRDYAPHDVNIIDKESLIYEITGDEILKNVPSWHHQAIKSIKNTSLKVTGTTTVSGEKIIEAIELPDKTFALGLQFHPEAAIVKNLDKVENKDNYMDYDTAIKFFQALAEAA